MTLTATLTARITVAAGTTQHAVVAAACDLSRYYLTLTHPIAVQVTVATWRNAEWLHDWFVTNVQGGNDDGVAREVTEEELAELMEEIDTSLGQLPEDHQFGFVDLNDRVQAREEIARVLGVVDDTAASLVYRGTR